MIISEANSCENNITKNKENQQEKLGYVYRHIRLDTNMPFYIGISAVNDDEYTRANSRNRSKEWKEVVKDNEYRVEILLKDILISVLEDKEKYFIKLYGRIDKGTGTLVNKTNGGRGSCGRIYITPQETRKKQSESHKGKKLSEDHIEKIRKANKGKKRTEESRGRISEGTKGNKNALGYRHTEESKNKMSEATPKKRVGQYKDGILIKEYPSIKSTELDGFISQNVCKCCNGERKNHKGYEWKYL